MKQTGFSLIEGIVIAVTVVIIGAVGVLAYKNLVAPKRTPIADQRPSASPSAITIDSKADLDTAASALDAVQLDDSDSGSLDSAANSF